MTKNFSESATFLLFETFNIQRQEEIALSGCSSLSAEEIVARYAAVIYRIAFSRLRNVPDAEDITQDVLLKYIRANKSFSDEDHRRKWLIRVTVNAINSLLGSAARKRSADLKEAENLPAPEVQESGIAEAIEKLDEKYRLPIHLFYFEDMSIIEIAEMLGCAAGTVKSLLSRGRSKLKKLLEEDEYV